MFLLSFVTQAAEIDSFSAPLLEVQREVASRQWRKAKGLIKHLEREQKETKGILLASDIIRLQLLKGYVLYKSNQSEEAFRIWRAAAVMNPGLEWELGIPIESDVKSTWSMLKQEIQSRKEILVRIPPSQTWYINGRLVEKNVFLYQGSHFFQRDCGSYVETHWFTLPGSLDWEETCLGESAKSNVALPLGLGIGGGVLLGAGLLSSFVWLDPQWRKIEDARRDPASITRAEADQQTQEFQTARWVSLGLLLGGGDQRLILGAGTALLFTLGFGLVPLSMRHRIRRMNHLAGLSEVSDRPHPPTRRTDTVGCDSNVLDGDNANPTNTYLEGSSFGDAGSSLHREE